MKRLNTGLTKIVLHELSRQPLSRTELEKRTIQKAGTHAAFESIFSYLVQGGYVKKVQQNIAQSMCSQKKALNS